MVALLFDHFGPYHLARLRAAGGAADVRGIEFYRRSADYGWAVAEGRAANVETLVLSAGRPAGWKGAFKTALEGALNELRPEVVVVPGWSAFESLWALKWCLANNVPAVVMSESCAHDERRSWLTEWVKGRVLGLFSAGLAGGRLHRDYLMRLGMAEEQIFLGYDAVDNEYFRTSAKKAKAGGKMPLSMADLTAPYFLASARFITKKNLPLLLRAYARYREAAGRPWSLVLLGDGPMRAELEALVVELKLEDCVLLPGFKQYEELPAYYAHARVFIHASTTEQWGLVVNEAMASGLPVLVSNRCGCAADLVRDGVNGYTFDPRDSEVLAQLMLRMSRLSDEELGRMGRAGEEIISQWGPERFAHGLLGAAEAATAKGPRQPGLFDRVLLKLLCLR
ncbi:glycosyltransferase [Prosthecobacter sp. SYSU 5D2]|uniref:glycosyltransferase n=1 Tax=Prosthecobacter sp. SYSU 5D2 TaxID=3134134 RepID=UPI0031FEA97D